MQGHFGFDQRLGGGECRLDILQRLQLRRQQRVGPAMLDQEEIILDQEIPEGLGFQPALGQRLHERMAHIIAPGGACPVAPLCEQPRHVKDGSRA